MFASVYEDDCTAESINNNDNGPLPLSPPSHCLFCLKPTPTVSVSVVPRELSVLERYLKMKTNSDLETQLCVNCDLLLETFCNFHEQRTLLDMKMEWELRKLRKVSVLASRDPGRKLFVGNVYHKNGQEEMMERMYSWRRCFSQKSLLKLSSTFPRVLLSRLSKSQVSRKSHRISPPSTGIAPGGVGTRTEGGVIKVEVESYRDDDEINETCEPNHAVPPFINDNETGNEPNASDDLQGGGAIKSEVVVEQCQDAEINMKCEVHYDIPEDTEGNAVPSEFPTTQYNNQEYTPHNKLHNPSTHNRWESGIFPATPPSNHQQSSDNVLEETSRAVISPSSSSLQNLINFANNFSEFNFGNSPPPIYHPPTRDLRWRQNTATGPVAPNYPSASGTQSYSPHELTVDRPHTQNTIHNDNNEYPNTIAKLMTMTQRIPIPTSPPCPYVPPSTLELRWNS